MDKEIYKQMEETRIILDKVCNAKAMEYATWTKEKAKMKFEKEMPLFPITSNYIYWCNLGVNIGSEQNKIRPVLIVKTSKNATICTIVPLTSERMNDTRWYHIDLEEQNSTVLVEQLRNISKLRIITPHRTKGKLTRINNEEWKKINSAIQKYYSLTPIQ